MNGSPERRRLLGLIGLTAAGYALRPLNALAINQPTSEAEEYISTTFIKNDMGTIVAAFLLTLKNEPGVGGVHLFMNRDFFEEDDKQFRLSIEMEALKEDREELSTVTLGIEFPELPSIIGRSTINNGGINGRAYEIGGLREGNQDISRLSTEWQEGRIVNLNWRSDTSRSPLHPLFRPSSFGNYSELDRISMTEGYSFYLPS